MVEALRYKPEGRGFDFSTIESFRPRYCPGVDSASNRNEYLEYFLGDKGGRSVWLKTLPPSYADYVEILRASTSWSPKGLSRSVEGLLTEAFKIQPTLSLNVKTQSA